MAKKAKPAKHRKAKGSASHSRRRKKEHAMPAAEHVKAAPHKGPVRGKGKMEVEFVTHIPDGEKKRIRHRVDSYSDILKLETNIDRLYSNLVKKGELKVHDIAKEFGVEPSLVEEWGHILEDHGLAELHYPAFGELVIRAKKAAKPAAEMTDEEKEPEDA